MAGVNRKVMVPGQPLDVSRILEDVTKNAVIYIPHEGKVILVFLSPTSLPSAWSMTYDQAAQFSIDVRQAYQAIVDDTKIAQMEREFDGD